jgi:peptide/nickel transport system permease protein
MGKYILRRLLQAVPTLLGVLVLTFLLTRLSPADPVTLAFGGDPSVTAEDKAALREALGLNQPLWVQFADWLAHVARLDFGKSYFYHRPVIEMLFERVPNSLQLTAASFVVTIIIGVPLGVIAALKRGKLVDHAIRIFSVAGHAIPAFWLGLIFVLVLGVQLRWFPIGSMNAIGKDDDVLDRLWHLIGPVLVLSIGGIAGLPRILRTEVLEVIAQDYVRTARSKGLTERAVIAGHVLRNALIPVVTLFGGILTIFFSGSLIIEQIFNWPGLGRLTYEAALSKDYPLLQAAVVVSSVLLILSYILRDIAYAWVDPRVKVG